LTEGGNKTLRPGRTMSSNDESLKNYYREYCNILEDIINTVKKKNRQVANSSNEIRIGIFQN
jgi:hypothetical protein